MAIVRKAQAQWKGTLKEGNGTVEVESGTLSSQYSFGSRFESGTGTNPEELLGAAEAGCYAMAFSLGLEQAGFKAEKIDASARVKLEQVDGGFRITTIHLDVEANIPGIANEEFQRLAEETKKNCPVSVALSGPEITLEARLAQEALI